MNAYSKVEVLFSQVSLFEFVHNDILRLNKANESSI